MRICGVDPGLRITGYAVLEMAGGAAAIIDAGTIRTDEHLDLSRRLQQVYSDLSELFIETQPEIVAVEEVYSHYRHPRTAVIMGHARGAILLAAACRDIPVSEYAATQIKRRLTGRGRASKSQMQQAVKVRLGLCELPEPHDVADALAIALCEVSAQREKTARQGALAAVRVSAQ